MSIYKFEIKGIESTTGTKYILVRSQRSGRPVLIPYAMFAGSGQEGLQNLRLHGMPIIGTKDSAAFVQTVASLDTFAKRLVVEKVGWNGQSAFGLPNGHVVSAPKAGALDIAFPVAAHDTEASGSLLKWRRHVARPMGGQPVLQFATMFMFAAPLLSLTNRHDNFGFELVSKGGKGKSTLQRIVASVAGATGRSGEGLYLSYFDTTMNALEETMVAHADLPLILEEANLFSQGETPRSLASKFRSFAFKMGSGTAKSRWGNPAGASIRLLYLSSSNEPLASVIGEESDAAKAAADRLITISLPETRPFGVLDSVPDCYPDAAAFMDALLNAASENYGHPLREFLARLVQSRAVDEVALKAQIEGWMALFRERAMVKSNDGSARRVADAFGLVYAAGKLAREYGVLPNSFNCGGSALACYNLHLERRRAGLSFAERLAELAGRSQVVDLGKGPLPSLTDEQFQSGIFKRRSSKGGELIIAQNRIESFIEDWRLVRNRDDVRKLLNMETGRKMIRRKICANRPKFRVYSFKI